MANFILLAIVSIIVIFYSYKIWKLYRPKQTLSCMEISDFKDAIQNKDNIQLIDIRSSKDFEALKISDAVNIPLDSLKAGLKQFDKNTKIIIICQSGSERSAKGALVAIQSGYDASWLCGGVNQWLKEF